MDCRTTLLLALSLSWGSLGCTQAIPTVIGTSGPPPVVAQSQANRPQRVPRAETCVAWAVCREHEAEDIPDASRKQDALDTARKAYQQALQIEPGYLPAYTGLAGIYMKMNHYDRALETYHKALQKAPKDAALWYELGMCHCRTKQWELAVPSFEKALQLDPENRAFTHALGFCQARAGLTHESIDTLARVMSKAEAHYNVARMLHHMKKDDLSRAFLNQAVQLDPNLASARSMLAALDGHCGAAIEDGAPAIQILFEEKN